MNNRFIYATPTVDRRPAVAQIDAGALQDSNVHADTLNETQHEAIQNLFQQLTRSLAVLSGTADLVSNGKASETHSQALRVWLHPNARQAEAAMHQLRDMRLTKSLALTELSQSLTVLVLAADMLTHGQLSSDDALTFYGLLRRNADSAIKSLAELRGQLLPEL